MANYWLYISMVWYGMNIPQCFASLCSTLCVPSVRNPSLAIVTTRSVAWPTARRTIISCLEICASSAIKSSLVTVSGSLEPGVNRPSIWRLFLTWHFPHHLPSPKNSVHRIEQGLVRSSLLLLDLRPEAGPEVQILRVRRETGVQKVLRAVPERAPSSLAHFARKHNQEAGPVKGGADVGFNNTLFCVPIMKAANRYELQTESNPHTLANAEHCVLENETYLNNQDEISN